MARSSKVRWVALHDRLWNWCLILCAANVVIRLWLAITFPLVAKEAEFWEWSQHLSLGYLEHPPLVAWVIRIFDEILPFSSLLNQRLGGVLLGTAIPFLIYRLGIQLFGDVRVARWALVLSLCLPSLSVFGVLLMPETCLILFQLLFLLFFHQALRGPRPSMWYAAGLALGLTALSHILGILVAVAAILFLLGSHPLRHWLTRKEPYCALVLALLVYAPFLWWNADHEWVSFRYQFWARHGGKMVFELSSIPEVLFEQLSHTLVLLFIPLIAAFWIRIHRTSPDWCLTRQMLTYQSGVVLGTILIAGCVVQTHPQWSVCAYPPLVLALAAIKVSRPRHGLVRHLELLAGATAVFLILSGIAIPLILKPVLSQSHVIGQYPSRGLRKAYHRLYEGEQLVAHISQALHNLSPQLSNQHWLAADPHLASILSFYSRQPVAFFDPRFALTPTNQLYYLDSNAYETGIFVGNAEVDWQPQLEREYSAVQYLDTVQLERSATANISYALFQVTHRTQPLPLPAQSTAIQTARRF